MTAEKRRELYRALSAIYNDSALTEREYFRDFRRSWDALFNRVIESEVSYLPENPEAVYTVSHRFAGVDLEFHFDQLKMEDWYHREMGQKKRTVYEPKKLKRSRSGVLTYHDSVCTYEPDATEAALTEKMKNIFACALPAMPPDLRVVYGNKWVDSRFSVFRQHSLQLFLIKTDYVPAFLGDPFEVCLYLFMMDCCIIKENYSKVKDPELKPLLHVFRPSPMLLVKGIIKK